MYLCKPVDEKLHVVVALSNPARYEARYRLYHEFQTYMTRNPRVQLHVVELAFADRPFFLTDRLKSPDVNYLQIRSRHELWVKENLLNIGISRLPSDANYICWCDADVIFANPRWAEETIECLQHYDFVQNFSTCYDLNSNYDPYKGFYGFMYAYHNGIRDQSNKYAQSYHPGFCWSATRAGLDKVGGLIDHAILGAADRAMACGLIGTVKDSYPDGLTKEYLQPLYIWQDRAQKDIKGNHGYVKGALWHYPHGQKVRRGYVSRWNILVNNKFNPLIDLKRDMNGVWQLTDNNPKLRDDIRSYFRERREDDAVYTQKVCL